MEPDQTNPRIAVDQTIGYERPQIVDYGDLVELTRGHSHGHFMDSAFHTGAHFEHPTFSDS